METSKTEAENNAAAESAPRWQDVAPGGLDEGDISLIRWMLELTPTERLERARDFLKGALALRNGRRVSH